MPKQSAKRQKVTIKPTFHPENYGTLWRDQVYTFLRPLDILKLSSTCKFLSELLNSQPAAFWRMLCSKHNITVVPSFEADAKHVLISNLTRKCFFCHTRTSYNFELAQIRLCQRCRGSDPRIEVISPTEAKKAYHLNADALRGIPSQTYHNRMYGSPCQLLLKVDVEQRAYEHYGSKEQWEVVHQKSLQRIAKLAETKAKRLEAKRLAIEMEREGRRARLKEAFDRQGLRMPALADSHRCLMFIRGMWGGPEDNFVQEELLHKIITNKEYWFPANEPFLVANENWPTEKERRWVRNRFEGWKMKNPNLYNSFLEL